VVPGDRPVVVAGMTGAAGRRPTPTSPT
jgi:hypothetical protein